VVHARLDGLDEPVDAECIYYLLTWAAGDFEFVTCVVEGDDRVNVSTTHLLMEGARLLDESNDPDAAGTPLAESTELIEPPTIPPLPPPVAAAHVVAEPVAAVDPVAAAPEPDAKSDASSTDDNWE
jgi:Domain of unknown function (DUF4388)